MDEVMKAVAQLLEEKWREVINTFPLHPSKNKRLDPDIKSALIEDINLIDVNGFSNTCLHTIVGSSIRHRASEINVPTLLIAGRYDKQFTPLIDYIRESIPNIEWLVLEGGHAVNLDAPKQFNKAILGFIEKF